MVEKKKSHYWFKKFLFAFRGFFSTLREEKSMIFHIISAIVCVVVAAILKITTTDWAIVMIIIAIVICVEFINTAIENLVDMISFKYNFNARKIKDIAAAATLIIAGGALASSLFIFIPRIIYFVNNGY